MTLIAGAAALVLATPPTLYFTLHNGSGNSAAAVPAPSPRATVTSAPTVTATAPPTSVPSTTTAPAAPAPAPAPDGRIASATLKNAVLDIPAWPKDNVPGRSGPVQFTNGQVSLPPDAAFPIWRYMVIDRIIYGDVDRDGKQETIAHIGAYVQGGSEQLIAFDRDWSGRIITLGSVASTTGPLRAIDVPSFSVAANGVISAKVADYAACCGDQTPILSQWRSYGWNGKQFKQVGGPTAFPNNPSVTETSLASNGLTLGPAVNGVRRGTLTVTVAYLYGTVPDHLSIGFYTGLQRDGSAWPPVHPVTSGNGFFVDVPTPALGTTKTYTFAFSGPANSAGQDFMVRVSGSGKQDTTALSEANPYNSTLQTTIRTTD